ncbi:type II secretion system F family protein [Silvanigrella aquatica]|uniref:Type II secretion system protein GspF domain-containing protein n=1 Tax=Silvanigrella aquatica TaxID=1915309 RepID=A0A1L4D1L2_9BACT|nr:type II secretion system F family protein [Silvanigrella aquatica]APJ04080.1 hypothetical protein AXG55_09240 [Silvanigrella aquatica]
MYFIVISFILNFIILNYFKIDLKLINLKPLQSRKNQYVSMLFATADFIDTILLHLEAGSNIFHSFKNATENSLNEDLKRNAKETLILYSMGCSFSDSLKNSINEKSDPFYNEMVECIHLSLLLGTTLKENLVQLSASLRIRAQLSIEESMSQAPVKMIFPLVFFIFPVIFILLVSGFIQDFISTMRF